jgi:hypothetical protein
MTNFGTADARGSIMQALRLLLLPTLSLLLFLCSTDASAEKICFRMPGASYYDAGGTLVATSCGQDSDCEVQGNRIKN